MKRVVKKKKVKDVVIDKFNSNRFSMFEVILLVFITLVFGVMIGYLITFKSRNYKTVVSENKVSEVYESIIKNYYKDISSDELAESAIKGMMDYLDDEYSTELSDSVYNDFNDQINGYFCGLGIAVFYENNGLFVFEVNKNGAADKAGIKANDVIYEVDGIKVDNENYTKLIKGKCGDKVNVKIKRADENLEFDITREAVSLDVVESQYFDVNEKYIGYIDVNVFSNNSYDLFVKELKRLEDKNISSLIIDLRSNPGGVLNSTRKIMNLFFEKNTTLYSYQSRNKETVIKDSSSQKRDYPIVILMNEDTASSAEIFISCFKECYGNVKLIGKSTYGKNTIQKSLFINDNYGIKYTISEWFTPKGNSVKDKGIVPDIEVEYGGPNFYDDLQLQKALDLLK